MLSKAWVYTSENTIDGIVTGNTIWEFEELLGKVLVFKGGVSNLISSFAFGEHGANADDADVNEFVGFIWVISTRVFEGAEMLENIEWHSRRVQPS